MCKALSPGLAHSRCSLDGAKLITYSESGWLYRENSPRIFSRSKAASLLGSGRQRKASASGVSEVEGWYFLLESLPLPYPYLSQRLSPSPGGRGTGRGARGWEGKAHRWAGGASVQVWPGCKGRGQMPSAPRGPLKSLRCQAGQGVCSVPRVLGACCHSPGQPGLGTRPREGKRLSGLPHSGLWLSSLQLVPPCLLCPSFPLWVFFFFSSSLPLPLSLPHSFFFPFTVSHSLLIFPPFSFHHPCSLYLFIPMTFWSLSLFPLCFSSSFPLSSSAIWLFLCLTLNPQNAATQGPEGSALRPREGWPCPL